MQMYDFLLKLKFHKIAYDSKTFWDKSLGNNTRNSHCWEGICNDCSHGEKIENDEPVIKCSHMETIGKR